VPVGRRLVREFRRLMLTDTVMLLRSPNHEAWLGLNPLLHNACTTLVILKIILIKVSQFNGIDFK
jgi:hypothetical protein